MQSFIFRLDRNKVKTIETHLGTITLIYSYSLASCSRESRMIKLLSMYVFVSFFKDSQYMSTFIMNCEVINNNVFETKIKDNTTAC